MHFFILVKKQQTNRALIFILLAFQELLLNNNHKYIFHLHMVYRYAFFNCLHFNNIPIPFLINIIKINNSINDDFIIINIISYVDIIIHINHRIMYLFFYEVIS